MFSRSDRQLDQWHRPQPRLDDARTFENGGVRAEAPGCPHASSPLSGQSRRTTSLVRSSVSLLTGACRYSPLRVRAIPVHRKCSCRSRKLSVEDGVTRPLYSTSFHQSIPHLLDNNDERL